MKGAEVIEAGEMLLNRISKGPCCRGCGCVGARAREREERNDEISLLSWSPRGILVVTKVHTLRELSSPDRFLGDQAPGERGHCLQLASVSFV